MITPKFKKKKNSEMEKAERGMTTFETRFVIDEKYVWIDVFRDGNWWNDALMVKQEDGTWRETEHYCGRSFHDFLINSNPECFRADGTFIHEINLTENNV